MEKITCLYDNKEFTSLKNLEIHIKRNYKKTYVQYLLEFGLSKPEDFMKCEECGEYCKSLCAHVQWTHPEMTFKEYRIKWNPSTVISESTKNKLSVLNMGENNSNHKSKTTIEYRKKLSPFSKEFYRDKYPELSDDELKLKVSNFAKIALKDAITGSKLEYWIKKCDGDIEQAKILYKQRQSTLSMNSCIEKYGNEEGIKVYDERQKKWEYSLLNNKKLKFGYSYISQELFDKILESLEYKDEVFYARKNNEIILKKEKYSYKYDFTYLKNKKIIEYNGDLYHANPMIYKNSDHPNPYRGNVTSEEIWKKDEYKLKLAKENGFDVLVIWDSDYKKNKEDIHKKCMEFLEPNNQINT